MRTKMTQGWKRLARPARWLAIPLLFAAAVGSWFLLDPGFGAARKVVNVPIDIPQDEFDRRVRAFILDNPEVIVEAAQRLQARQRATEATEARVVLKQRAAEVTHDPASPVGGNLDGDVSLVEFFDYNCPYCRRVAPAMVEAEAADPRLRIVYKEFPILGPNSIFAAKAALAAHRQGAYIALHKTLMQGKGVVDEKAVLEAAAKVGLNLEKLKADMNDPAIQQAIDRNLDLAQALRINGTPGFVVGDQIVRGATDIKTLQTLIARARRQSAQ